MKGLTRLPPINMLIVFQFRDSGLWELLFPRNDPEKVFPEGLFAVAETQSLRPWHPRCNPSEKTSSNCWIYSFICVMNLFQPFLEFLWPRFNFFSTPRGGIWVSICSIRESKETVRVKNFSLLYLSIYLLYWLIAYYRDFFRFYFLLLSFLGQSLSQAKKANREI